jgi:hypothetical protein
MTYDPDALRQMNDEAQMRIAELSTALGLVTDQRDNHPRLTRRSHPRTRRLQTTRSALTSTVERLRLHIAQGVEL